MGRLVAPPILALAALSLLAGCGGGDATGADPTDQGGRTIVVRVFAAASLTEAMTDLERAFEAAEPTVDIELNLAGSATLRAQILEGAPADVVATANRPVIDDLAAADLLAGPPRPFASNRLVIALAPDNPGDITGLADLAEAEVFLGLCAAGVPCGDLADAVLTAAGIEVEADSRETDVRTLLTKIEAGELDAGLVYATDVAASAAVTGIDLDAGLPATTTYPVAVVAGTGVGEAAGRFTDFLTGPTGREVLAGHGFGAP